MKKSIKLNGILNVIKKCCNIILPLLVFPYISRVLGPDNYGKFSFSNSIISYFMLTALLGIETYAVREGARIRNDKHRIDKFVSEVFSINIMSLIISYIFLLFFIKTDTISKIAHCACLKSLCNYMTDTLLQLCYRCPIPRRYGKLQCFYTVRFLLRNFRYHNKLYCGACFHSAVIGGDIVV